MFKQMPRALTRKAHFKRFSVPKLMFGISTIALLAFTLIYLRQLYSFSAFSCEGLLLGLLWLTLVQARAGRLLKGYVYIFSRLEFTLPLVFAAVLFLLQMVAGPASLIGYCFIGFIWLIALSYAYQSTGADYISEHAAPVKRDTWLSPPPDVLQPGDIILTQNRIGDILLHERFGHGELFLCDPDGQPHFMSSYMHEGLVINPLSRVAEKTLPDGYIIMRPNKPLTDEQKRGLWTIALRMHRMNHVWRANENRWRRQLIDRLPLPKDWKRKLKRRVTVDGYDWLGLIDGRIPRAHWTCVVSVLVNLFLNGIPMAEDYGIGILGLGTGLLDPIRPEQLIFDPYFHYLTLKDKAKWEKQHGLPQ